MKESISKFLDDFFNTLGIEPIYGITFLFFLIIIPTTKKIKVWSSLSKTEKEFYILGWLAAIVCLIICVITFIRNN
ncbi:MAG TPA: hypothetical protein VLH59_09435 [Ignavibacteriaceae bacterium]|nr:hypothetical protein [Ignavibacteriaceae bacterium]